MANSTKPQLSFEKINNLLDTANEIRTSNPKRFTEIIIQLENSTDLLSTEQSNNLNYFSAYRLIYQGKMKQASSMFLALLKSNDSSSLIKFKSRITLVNIMGINQNWTNGLYHLNILLNDLPSIKHQDTRNTGIAITAAFYNQLGQYSLALKYAQSSDIKEPTSRILCLTQTVIFESKLHLRLLKNNDAVSPIEFCKDEPIATNFIRSYIAKFYIYNNDFNEAIKLLTPHISEITKTNYPRLITEVFSSLSKAHWGLNNAQRAESYALKSTKAGNSITTTQSVVLAYKLLYQINLQRQNYKSALNYHEEFFKLDKAHIDETKAKHLAYQLAKHQAFEAESMIKLLREKNALLVSEQALAKANVENIQLFITILTITIALLLLWAGRLWKSHKRVKQLAEYDTLTGIFSRGHFTQITTSALSYCKNAQQPLSLIMFDLDFFKKVNDSYGHACGDWVLKEVVRVCKATGRTNDIFARVGGEEFCLVLPSCQLNAAIERAETCRAAIESINTSATGHNFSVSASFGVTDAKHSGYTLDNLLANADLAAYQAKHNGRNKVSVFK